MPNSITFSSEQPINPVAQLEASRKLLEARNAAIELHSIENELKRTEFVQAAENIQFGNTELVNRADYLPVGWNFGFGQNGIGGPFTYSSTTDRYEGRDYPFVMSEVDLNYARGMARFLIKTHCSGVAIERNLKSHVISEGGNYTAGRKKKTSVPDGLISLVQDVIDEFIHENNIDGELEQEWFWRPHRDGDMFIALYPLPKNQRGVCLARELEPERIRTPGGPLYNNHELEEYFNVNVHGESNWTFGIHKSNADIQKVYGYCVDWDMNERLDGWEYLPAKFVEMRKMNVDRNIARGMTDFYPAWTWMKQQQRLQLNTGEGAAERAAISYIIEHVQGIVKGQAVSMRQEQADYSYSIFNPQGNSKTFYKEYRPPGTKLDVPKGQEYVAIAQGVDPSGAYLEVAQSIIRMVASMWAMPEGMISGKMDTGAYASAIAAGSTFSKYATMEQGSFQAFMIRILWKVLRFAFEQRRFERFGFAPNAQGSWDAFKRHIEIIAMHPDVATQDPQKAEIVRETRRRNGVLSLKTWRDEVGLDDETESKNIEGEPQAQGAGGQAAGQPPSSAPPGNGSGDASATQPGQTQGQSLSSIKGPSNSQFGGHPKNYTDVQSEIQSAINLALTPIIDKLKQSMEAHAPAGFTHDKPLILKGNSYVGGEFIPGMDQNAVNTAAQNQQNQPNQGNPQNTDQKKTTDPKTTEKLSDGDVSNSSNVVRGTGGSSERLVTMGSSSIGKGSIYLVTGDLNGVPVHRWEVDGFNDGIKERSGEWTENKEDASNQAHEVMMKINSVLKSDRSKATMDSLNSESSKAFANNLHAHVEKIVPDKRLQSVRDDINLQNERYKKLTTTFSDSEQEWNKSLDRMDVLGKQDSGSDEYKKEKDKFEFYTKLTKKTSDEMKTVKDRFMASQKMEQQFLEQRRVAAFKALSVADNVNIKPDRYKGATDHFESLMNAKYDSQSPDESVKKSASKVFNELSKLISSKAYSGNKDASIGLYQVPVGEREFQLGKSVFINPLTQPRTIAHEAGHAIEEQTGTAKTMNDFVSKRCGDEEKTSLRKKFGDRFDKKEFGRKDGWNELTRAMGMGDASAYYIGKTYKDGSTEVLSMGLEMLYRDAATFAKTDPEYFNLVVGVLRGTVK